MTINTNPSPRTPDRVPEFTLGDRLRKARETARMEMQDIAREIDIHRQSVARYESGAATPRRHVLMSWSLATGTDLNWLETGRTDAVSTFDTESASSTDSVSNLIERPIFRMIPGFFSGLAN